MKLPDRQTNHEGAPRRAGFEIEFAGVEIDDCAELVTKVFPGAVTKVHKTLYHVDTEDAGRFNVELDVKLARKISEIAKKHEDELPGDVTLPKLADEVVPELVSLVAPTELVSPPLEFSRFEDFKKLIALLREHGAQGTDASMLYAFGVHVNAEAPSLEAEDILAFIQAFALLYEWLHKHLAMNFARKMTPFLAPWSPQYHDLVLDTQYRPGMTRLIDEYIAHNPSRNHALDMMALFAHIDEDLVRSKVEDALIKPRPAYHFRMPNCRIEDEDWNIDEGWDAWVMVDDLAGDAGLLAAMIEDYRETGRGVTLPFDRTWLKRIEEKWLPDLS